MDFSEFSRPLTIYTFKELEGQRNLRDGRETMGNTVLRGRSGWWVEGELKSEKEGREEEN